VKDRFVIDGKRLTTSGSFPTVDLMLEMIRQRQGYSLALEVSRLFRYEQPSFHADEQLSAASAGLRMHDPRVAQAVRLMEEHIEQPFILARWARKVGISARHLQDLFHQNIGAPPHVHYLALRLNAARRNRDDGLLRRYRGGDRLRLGLSLCEKLPGEFFRKPVGDPPPLASPHYVIAGADIGRNASRTISASSRTASLER